MALYYSCVDSYFPLAFICFSINGSVYIVKCSDKTFYTGITNNIKLRLDTHNAGNGAKYTKNRFGYFGVSRK